MRARRHSSWRDDGKKSEVWFQRSLSNIIQIGQHDLSLEVKGVGFIASVVRSIVTSFQVKRRIKRTVTNEGKTCIIRKIHQKQKYIFLSTNVFSSLKNVCPGQVRQVFTILKYLDHSSYYSYWQYLMLGYSSACVVTFAAYFFPR